MMARTTLCILALGVGIDTTGAFQAPRHTTGLSRPTELRSVNDLYGAGGSYNTGRSDYAQQPLSGSETMAAPVGQMTAPLRKLSRARALVESMPQQSIQAFGGTFSQGSVRDSPGRRQVDGEESTILVQGGSLRTWSYRSPQVEAVQVILSTEGRPLDADIELWNGPDNTPSKMRVYVENGQMRPFSAVIETPRSPNTVAIRNIGQIEFPFAADVYANGVEEPSDDCIRSSATIQGGALRTYPFDTFVDSVQVLLKTDGRPLNARVELLQGPNNNKQVIELYTEDGFDRPFFCILETPGSGNVVRIVNTAPVEFPMTAGVVPMAMNNGMSQVGYEGDFGAVLGGDLRW